MSKAGEFSIGRDSLLSNVKNIHSSRTKLIRGDSMIELRSIKEAIDFAVKLEEEEPYTEEDLKKDIEQAESGNYNIQARVRSKGSLTFRVPDTTRPLGVMKVEAGTATVEGFGRTKIKFKETFSDTPGLIETKFGFFELRVPWVVVEWRYFRIAWWRLRLPVPRLTTMTIRLPVMCFLMNIDKEGFEVFNVAGRTNIVYLAIGR